jgi:hypothetical protein
VCHGHVIEIHTHSTGLACPRGALGALGQDTRERLCSHPLRGRSSRMPCFVVPSCPSSPRLLYACLVLAWRAGSLAAWLPSFLLPALQSSLRSAAPTPAAWGLLRAGLSQRCGKPPLARARPAACTTHASPFACLSLPSLFLLSLPPSLPPSLSLTSCTFAEIYELRVDDNLWVALGLRLVIRVACQTAGSHTSNYC